MVAESSMAASRLFVALTLCVSFSSCEAFTANSFAGPKSKLQAVKEELPAEADVIVIGSGLAGLSCGALVSSCGKSVVVLESHDGTCSGSCSCSHSFSNIQQHLVGLATLGHDVVSSLKVVQACTLD
jgi:heterodisulfide reductase subunit A-like polyferredoxin